MLEVYKCWKCILGMTKISQRGDSRLSEPLPKEIDRREVVEIWHILWRNWLISLVLISTYVTNQQRVEHAVVSIWAWLVVYLSLTHLSELDSWLLQHQVIWVPYMFLPLPKQKIEGSCYGNKSWEQELNLSRSWHKSTLVLTILRSN